MATEINPHCVPEEYTEVACLLGFVQRLAERMDKPRIVEICRLAHRGHPTAISEILEMAAALIAAVHEFPAT